MCSCIHVLMYDGMDKRLWFTYYFWLNNIYKSWSRHVPSFICFMKLFSCSKVPCMCATSVEMCLCCINIHAHSTLDTRTTLSNKNLLHNCIANCNLERSPCFTCVSMLHMCVHASHVCPCFTCVSMLHICVCSRVHRACSTHIYTQRTCFIIASSMATSGGANAGDSTK
jgi:hypothetical protein